MQCFMCSHRHRGCPHLVGLQPDFTQLGLHTVKTAITSYTPPVPLGTYRGRFSIVWADKGKRGYPRCEEFPRLHGGNSGVCPRFTRITNAHTHTHTHTHTHSHTQSCVSLFVFNTCQGISFLVQQSNLLCIFDMTAIQNISCVAVFFHRSVQNFI